MFHLIASYPKSGNTYVRIFLAHYTRGNTNLNTVGFPIFNSKANFPLYPPNRATLQPFKETRVCKTHEIATGFSHRFVGRALYLVRNPLDVCFSYSRHMDMPMERTIIAMRNPANTLSGNGKIYRQRVGSWSGNVLSWMRSSVSGKFPVLIVKYESLVSNPNGSFRSIIDFLGLPYDRARFGASIEYSRFESLKERESKMLAESKLAKEPDGIHAGKHIRYKEARGSTGRFFNIGKANQWKGKLSEEQMIQLLEDHGQVMTLLGYAEEV